MAFQVEASFLSVRIVLESLPLGPRLFRSFLSKERIMAQKYFREMGNLGQHVPRHQSKMISRYHGLEILFCSWKGLAGLKLLANLDAYQITKYQFFFFKKKTHHFLLPDFRRIREEFLNQEF